MTDLLRDSYASARYPVSVWGLGLQFGGVFDFVYVDAAVQPHFSAEIPNRRFVVTALLQKLACLYGISVALITWQTRQPDVLIGLGLAQSTERCESGVEVRHGSLILDTVPND